MKISHTQRTPKMAMVIDVNISETSYSAAIELIRDWARLGESRAVYATNVHCIMEAYDHPEYKRVLNRADLTTPDGVPLVWMLRWKGVRDQKRVYGPDLMLYILDMAEREYIPVGLYGTQPDTLKKLTARIQQKYPKLQIAYTYSPPFRPLLEEELLQVRSEIIASGTKILFVGLGCPRQEKWIDCQLGLIPAVMVGVGAAFDFHAGLKPQAPAWMQKNGLEWLFRLLTEPRRLWKRYLIQNPRFLVLAMIDLLGFLRKAN